MSETIRELGEAVTFALSVIDRDTPANNPVTGEAPTIAIRRLSDDYWYDFVAGTWGAVVGGYAGLAADNTAAMTDKADGTYEYDWDQDTADGGATRSYEAVYEIAAGTYRSMAYEIWVFRSVATAGGLALEATLNRALGMVQENQYIDTFARDGQDRMISARLRTYSVAGSVGTDNDVLATYTITATYTGTSTVPVTYKAVRV